MVKAMQNKLKEHRRQRMYEYQLDLEQKNRTKRQQMEELRYNKKYKPQTIQKSSYKK